MIDELHSSSGVLQPRTPPVSPLFIHLPRTREARSLHKSSTVHEVLANEGWIGSNSSQLLGDIEFHFEYTPSADVS